MGLQAKKGQALTLSESQSRLSKDVSGQYFCGYKRHFTHVTQKCVGIINSYIFDLHTAVCFIEQEQKLLTCSDFNRI